jgi:LmbE family N-acetylglucosaminyl deacetylase
VDAVDFLGLPDGVLEYGVGLRRAITASVRRHRPEIVITNNFRDTWGGRNLNQADHIAVGKATLDAVRDAGNRWVFGEQLADGMEPWGGVAEVWAPGSPDAEHGVDTTDTMALGVESLAAHQAYIDGLGWAEFDPDEFLQSMARQTGSRLGVTFGASFEVFPMGWGA